ncbi:hypothetical protein [Streptococcus sp. HMSC061D10]|jgi:hypothetical protein|uniref:hypothetical protein n=1 Tax=Streptococcus sp. HMSC061D10 TaxID=1715207 RepID=UPI0008B35D22|nr:hypothetical protein [Streptococcus sp. HMSC061D10]OFN83061.1 hypothetical protein HMPREF2728_03595 [Streptococcus sp. HMSC061D10]
MELSDVIAIFALLISGFALYKQIKKDKVSQNTVFFNQIFLNFLTQDCVEARNDIRFDNRGRLENTKKFEELIAELGNKISFYEYVDKIFYDQLKNLLTELDDLVVDDKEYKGKKQTDHSNKIDKKISELFKLIMDKYFIK